MEPSWNVHCGLWELVIYCHEGGFVGLESLWYHPRNFGSAHSYCLPQVLEIVRKLESRQRGWEEEEDPERKGTIVFNATSEFCRTLGEIPTYGLAGNREEQEELMVGQLLPWHAVFRLVTSGSSA